MKIGVVLPTFTWSPEEALSVAAAAADAGVHGVFAYDHLWPMGNPSRPALAPFPVLASIAARHSQLFVGPLVARIGLVSNETLVSQLRALEAIAPGRCIAALGTGDKLSAAENEAYGVPFASAQQRRADLGEVAATLHGEGMTVWIGGGARPTVAMAEEMGCAVNMWGATPDAVGEQVARSEVTWAGLLPKDDSGNHNDAARDLLGRLDEAGATWAVVGWPAPLEILGEVSGT